MTALATLPVESPLPATERPAPARSKFMEHVTKPAPKKPSALILFANEGWGKTSWAACAPSPIFQLVGQETGLWTLINNGRLPDQVPFFPRPAQTWTEILKNIDLLLSEEHSFKTYVLDTVGGAEALLHQYVCDNEFNGDWGENGFMAWQRGYRLAVPQLQTFLAKLDQLRDRGMAVILLAHCQISTFKAPDSADYDRYSPALHKDSWAVLHRWADVILFGHRKTPQLTGTAKSGKKPAKAKLTNLDQPRVLLTERTAAYDAKNRCGLPPEIPCGNSAKEAWERFAAEMKGTTT